MSHPWLDAGRWRRSGRVLTWLYSVVVLGVAGALMVSTARLNLTQRDLETLAYCVPWLVLAHACSCLALHAILCSQADGIALGLVARAHLRHIPLRYLPGGVWHLVGRIAELKLGGVSSRALMWLPILESILAMLAALGLAGLIAVGTTVQAHALSFISGLGALTWLLLSLHDLLSPKRRYMRAGTSVLVAFMAMLAFWVCLLHAFLVYFKSLGSSLLVEETSLAVAYLLSWVVGHVAIFAPQGLGVSEVVFSTLTQGGVEAGLLAGAFRIILMVGDVVTWAAFHLSVLIQAKASGTA